MHVKRGVNQNFVGTANNMYHKELCLVKKELANYAYLGKFVDAIVLKKSRHWRERKKTHTHTQY
jgi:hypothetical protein